MTRHARAIVRAASRHPRGVVAAAARHLREAGDRAWRDRHELQWAPAQAVRAIQIISGFIQYKGEWAGRPLVLQPWQQFIVGSLFGWRHRDGRRRFRTAFVEVPRGNGKSALAAAIGLYCGFLDDEPGAETYSVATKRDQARIVFEHAREMVSRTPALHKRITVQRHVLYHALSASKFEPLSSDADTLDGHRPHCVIADEVHAHPDASVIDIMRTGMGTRRHPLLFAITTAGLSRTGPWWAYREYTWHVLEQTEGYEDPSWFGIIYSTDPDEDWTDPDVWRKVNPGYGEQVKPEFLAQECQRAVKLIGYQNTFRRLHVGQLVEQDHRYLDMTQWDACAAPVNEEDLVGRWCVAGLDLSTRSDLTACVLVFPDDDQGITVLTRLYCPADTIAARSREDRVPYDQWAATGWITPTPGTIVDYDYIRRDIHELAARYRIVEIGYDPWNATHLATQLQSDGFQMIEVRQGVRTLSEPTKQLAALVAAGKVRHGGHPVLRWMARNFVVREDANGNLAPDKGRSRERIDGIVALIMGLQRLAAHTSPQDLLVAVV